MSNVFLPVSASATRGGVGAAKEDLPMNPAFPAPFFVGAFPIGDTSVSALPVKHLGPAIAFYTHVLGFTVTESGEKSATLKRGDAVIGLAENEADPEQASVYFEVRDLDALHRELTEKHTAPTPISLSENDGKNYRVFFAREPYGVCFCFGQQE